MNWLFYDGHGNMVSTMNTSFALSAFQWRGVWGERTTSNAGRGYCANLGHPEDETGLVYMRARYYEPTTERFISEDPARDGMNWYLYADGDPVGKVDASGKRALPSPFIATVMLLLFGNLLDKILDLFDLHRSHPAVVHALKAVVNILEAFGAILTAIDVGSRIDRIRNPMLRGYYTTAMIFAVAVVATAAKAVAAREFALMLLVLLDPTAHHGYPGD